MFFLDCTNQPESDNKADPKLILQITVDQLRADLPLQVMDRLPEGGLRYLYEKGVVYQDAHHAHANTETVVGHATLATGAYPSAHGMVTNLWYDRTLGRAVYNVEDSQYPLVGSSTGVDKDAEIDPSQAAAGTEGRSPNTIIASTFSDELAKATNGKAKIFGVSVKDRGAITLAGHEGKAFWFSKSSGDFISSTYYYEEYPEWVSKWNDQDLHLNYSNTNWELSRDESDYVYKNSDDASYKTKFPGFGVNFPHAFGKADNPYFTTFLTLSPVGDDLTLDFTKNLIEAEDIGHDDVTDFLAVSFSSTDYVDHIFGLSSIESEDNLFRLDRTIAELLEVIDQKVGLENTLIVLSADHGGVDAPSVLRTKGIDAGYIDAAPFNVEKLNTLVKEELKTDKELISSFYYPYVYYNQAKMDEAGIKADEVFPVLKSYMESINGVQEVVDCRAMVNAKKPTEDHYELIFNNYHPDRSGDIAVVVKPYWYINDFEGLIVASTHGAPWEYDTHVPIVFAGHGIKPQQVSRKVQTVDIALTLSNYVSIKIPSKAVGESLKEIQIK